MFNLKFVRARPHAVVVVVVVLRFDGCTGAEQAGNSPAAAEPNTAARALLLRNPQSWTNVKTCSRALNQCTQR